MTFMRFVTLRYRRTKLREETSGNGKLLKIQRQHLVGNSWRSRGLVHGKTYLAMQSSCRGRRRTSRRRSRGDVAGPRGEAAVIIYRAVPSGLRLWPRRRPPCREASRSATALLSRCESEIAGRILRRRRLSRSRSRGGKPPDRAIKARSIHEPRRADLVITRQYAEIRVRAVVLRRSTMRREIDSRLASVLAHARADRVEFLTRERR